jgi:predicted RND superfamily exporter protein
MKRFFDEFFFSLFSLVIKHPWWALVPILIISVLTGSQLSKIKLMTDLKSLQPYDEVYKNNERIKDEFNIKDSIIIGVRQDEDLFNIKTFDYLKNIIDKIELLKGVSKIRSLFSEDNIKSTSKKTLDISPFVKKTDSESLEESIEQIKNFKAVQGILVSKDFTLTTIMVELEADAEKSKVYFNIKKILDKDPPLNGEHIYLSGMPVFQGVLGNYLLKDLMVMLPLITIIIIVFLYFTYRSFLLVGVSRIVIFLVDVWTLGFMAFLDHPLYIIQSAMPVILMALSVADEIHIFGRYFEECKNSSSEIREKILVTMQEMWKPVILTSITTAFGFLALITTSMRPLQYFGAFTALGIMAAMILSLIITPAVLILFGEKERYKVSHTLLDKFLLSAGNFMFKNRIWIRVLIVVIIVVSFIGMSKVFIEDSWISNFKKTSLVYTDDEALNNKISGTNILYVELDTQTPNGIKNPDFLKKVAQFQKGLKAVDYIGGSISIAQIIEKMNLEFNGTYDIPDSSNAIAQYILLLDGTTHERFWDYSYQKVNILIFTNNLGYINGTSMLDGIRSYLNEYLSGIKVTFGGEIFLSHHCVDLLRTDQLKSFFTSLALIFLVSSGVFWSFRKGIIVTTPIIVAVLMNYGILGFLKLPISISVSIVSSIIMGIGIDYAIHLQSKFDFLSDKMETEDAIPSTFLTAGKAILWNAAVVISGFLILIFSEMPPNQKFGLVCVLGVATSLISSFLVVPAVLSAKKYHKNN